MMKLPWAFRRLVPALLAPLFTALILALAPPAAAQSYRQANLVSDVSGLAPLTDPALVNPWGMSLSATSPLWVSNAGSNSSTVYSINGTTGAVAKVALNVSVPGAPTGQVFNGTPGFVVSQGGASGVASFIFASMDGTVSGWNSKVPPPAAASVSMQAIVAATGAAGSHYTGLTLATRGTDPFLYAANQGLGRIDVFDQHFAPATLPGSFTDPNLPAGDRPYNISNLGGSLYATYIGPTPVVNVFDVNGNFTRRLATGGTLRNPWGTTLAPADFGAFSNAVLVGNFNFGNPTSGPGTISAFAADTGQFLGMMKDPNGNAISIDGLWTLLFGNGGNGGAKNVLYFSAGIQNQMHGLLGSLSPA
jgi:uncharacterized protein (TIGR03118 family)